MTPEGWRMGTLAAVLEAKSEHVVPAKEDDRPYVALEHIAQGTPRLLGWDRAGNAESTKVVFQRGDLLFGKLRPNLKKAVLAPFDGVCSTDILVLRARSGVDANFVQHLAHWTPLQEHAISTASGTKMPRTSWSLLAPFEFAVPPLPEQRKIAAILTSVDEAIEATQAVIDQLQVVKKAMMAELLTRGLPGRHTRFKMTEIGEMPEGWEVTAVGACCDIRNDLRRPINEAERSKMQGPFPYYGPTKQIDSLNEYRLDGTFALIGEDGDHFLKFDRWKMTQLAKGRFNVNNHAHVVAGTSRCSADWFALFFQHRDITPRLTRQGATRYKLRKATLEELPIALPSQDEQKTICQTLQQVEQRIASEEATAAGLRDTKTALMSVLLTGEVRVQPDQAWTKNDLPTARQVQPEGLGLPVDP